MKRDFTLAFGVFTVILDFIFEYAALTGRLLSYGMFIPGRCPGLIISFPFREFWFVVFNTRLTKLIVVFNVYH